MLGRLAFRDGRLVSESEAQRLTLFDHGFAYADQIYDATRTCGHQPFRLEDHLQRLYRSARATKLEIPYSYTDLLDHTHELLAHNLRGLPPEHELDTFHYVTGGGDGPSFAVPYRGHPPRVIIYCEVSRPQRFAGQYDAGVHMIVPSIRHCPPQVLDPRIKHRNRLHFVLAELEVKQRDPAAVALLLDLDGAVTETPQANLFVVSGGTLRTPRPSHVLNGVSRQVVMELAERRGLKVEETNLQPYDVATADEAFLTNTVCFLLPATRFDGRPIGAGLPGPVTRQLIDDYVELTGYDFVARAGR